MKRKKEVIRLIHYAQQMLHDLVEQTPVEILEECGEVTDWSFKDQMMHLAHWLDRFNRALASKSSPAKYENLDIENARIWQLYHAKNWAWINTKLDQAYDGIHRLTRSLSEDELVMEDYIMNSNRAPWIAILDSALSHPITHISAIYIERGSSEKSVAVMSTIYEDLLGIDPNPRWQGVVTYNLACLNALAGYQDQALALLHSALPHYPDLAEWAREDPDMKPLQTLPQFIALTSKSGLNT